MADAANSEDAREQRLRELLERISRHCGGGGSISFDLKELEAKGILSAEEVGFLMAGISTYGMQDTDMGDVPEAALHRLLTKVVRYQNTLQENRPVPLDELVSMGVITEADQEFVAAKEVTYKPHKRTDFHAMDMFHMPTEGGGCLLIGPSGPPLRKRTAAIKDFPGVVERFLALPNEDLLLHIDFGNEDGLGVAPGFIAFGLRSPAGRAWIPGIERTAARLGIEVWQNEDIQGGQTLSYRVEKALGVTASATIELMRDGCGYTDGQVVKYSAGALDELE